MVPVNFSLTDFEPTHIMSADAILAITLATCQSTSQPREPIKIHKTPHQKKKKKITLLALIQ